MRSLRERPVWVRYAFRVKDGAKRRKRMFLCWLLGHRRDDPSRVSHFICDRCWKSVR